MMTFAEGVITEEAAEKAAEIVREVLEERFKDEDLVFHQILALQRFDHDDDEYLEFYIIYEGDRKLLDPGWTKSLIGIVPPQLTELGIPYPAGKSFIPKHEWDEMRRD